jgi:hypothetical protein
MFRLKPSSSQTMSMIVRRLRTTLVLVFLAPLVGCVTTNFTQPVASFQQSVNTSASALGEYFTSLNTLERTLYFDELAADPAKELAAKKDGKPTAFAGAYFSPESIKARTDSLVLLGVYAQHLADLAGSDPGSKFSTNITALGTSLNSLDKTFTSLGTSTPGKTSSDSTAANYVGPVSALIGSIGKMYLDSERDSAIQEAVNKGAPSVNAILDLLETDLSNVVGPLVDTNLKIQEGLAVQDYNQRRAKLTIEQRGALLITIGQKKDAYDASIAHNPATLIQSSRSANTALVTYANAPKVAKNFADFTSAMQTFQQRAQEIANDVKAIENVH